MTTTRGRTSRCAGLDRLALGMTGRVVMPEDGTYDEERKVWNGMIDRRPAGIAICRTAEDVRQAIFHARSRGLAVAVRAGGHNVAGCSVCDGGLVIDVSPMKDVTVDPNQRIARAGAGLTLGEFDAATQACGLATTMGVNSDTGIAGLTLGGGFGKLGRKHGLACDNLIAAEVVTANGRILSASATENSDLFWALRGGGGNFGVVTRFEYKLHPIGPEILAGSLLCDADHARSAMEAYQAYASTAPDEVDTDAALVLDPMGRPAFSISFLYAGTIEAGQDAVAGLRARLAPVEDTIAPTTYLAVQSAGDSVFPRGRRYFWKAQYLMELSTGAIDRMLDAVSSAPSSNCMIVLQQVGGAIARVASDATAYANREAAYDCFPVAIWDDPAEDEAHMEWARSFWAALRPFSTGTVYANNLGDEGESRVREAFGGNYERLARIKRKYDPTNLFRLNQNILPAR